MTYVCRWRFSFNHNRFCGTFNLVSIGWFDFGDTRQCSQINDGWRIEPYKICISHAKLSKLPMKGQVMHFIFGISHIVQPIRTEIPYRQTLRHSISFHFVRTVKCRKLISLLWYMYVFKAAISASANMEWFFFYFYERKRPIVCFLVCVVNIRLSIVIS